MSRHVPSMAVADVLSRLGGVSAAIAGFMLYRMSKRFGHDPL